MTFEKPVPGLCLSSPFTVSLKASTCVGPLRPTLGISLFRHALGKIDTLLISLTLLRNFFTPMQSGLFKCKRSFPRLNLASGIQSPRMKSRRVVTQSKMVSKPLMKEEATRIGCVLQTSNEIIY